MSRVKRPMKAIPMPVVDVPLQYLIVVFPRKTVPHLVIQIPNMLIMEHAGKPPVLPMLLPNKPAPHFPVTLTYNILPMETVAHILVVLTPLPQLPVLPTVVILGAMWYLMEIVQPRPVLQSLIILLPQSLA